MKIGIASDHRGYDLKGKLTNILEEEGYNIIDYGTYSSELVDYPMYAFKLCNGVISKEIEFGITICGTGIGMSIACNKVKGIRCAKIDNVEDAKYAKTHNNANVISISSKKNIDEIKEMIEIFISNQLDSNERYLRRIKQVEEYENEH
jgi:ribose 5-phosphate isomerase B